VIDECELNSGEACVHRTRDFNAPSTEPAAATEGIRIPCVYCGFRYRSILAHLQQLADQDQIAR
jgi:hypothetical protein